MTPLHNYEPSRKIKQLYLRTRKADRALGGTPQPSLFKTAHAAGAALALLLEIYGLAHLIYVRSVALPAALAQVALDIAGALLSYHRQENSCHVVLTDGPAGKARIQHRDKLRDRAIHTVRLVVIAGSAVWKIVSFSTIGGLDDRPAAVIALGCICYFAGRCLQQACWRSMDRGRLCRLQSKNGEQRSPVATS